MNPLNGRLPYRYRRFSHSCCLTKVSFCLHLIQLKKPRMPPLPSHPSSWMSDSSGTSSGYHLSLNETYDLIFVLYTILYVIYTPTKTTGCPSCQRFLCLSDIQRCREGLGAYSKVSCYQINNRVFLRDSWTLSTQIINRSPSLGDDQ